MIYRFIIIITCLSFIVGCSDDKKSERLSHIENLISDSPQKALASLDSIEYDSLSDADKQYFDFLTIKANDKAFIRHTSDTLVLKVIEQESKNSGKERYNEALYYGGRVYHDLGDLPTALNYYQTALDNLNGNEESQALKGKILSQICGVLLSLRLYAQAIPYANDAIALDSIKKDSLNLMYDTELLGKIYLHAKNYASAESTFNKSKKLAKDIAPADTTRLNMYLAAIKYYNGEIKPAITLIRPSVSDIDTIARNVALAYACKIYNEAGIQDTAMMYALELIHSKNPNNRKTGYQVLLSDELSDLIPPDSIQHFIRDYRETVESYLNRNGDQAALIQNSLYNYSKHQRDKIKTEEANKKLLIWLTGLLIALLVMVIFILYHKYRNKSQLVKLHEAINYVKTLRQSIFNKKDIGSDSSSDEVISVSEMEIAPETTSYSLDELRQKLDRELLSMSGEGTLPYSVPEVILESQAYGKLTEYISDNRIIPENNPVWNELEEIVLRCFPDFKHRLRLLSGGKLKTTDLHLVMLIKCGITSTHISKAVGRAKSTIVYRKDTLGIRLFGEKMDIKKIDNLIRLL